MGKGSSVGLKEIKKVLSKYPNALKVFEIIENNDEIMSILEMANNVAIGRMGYNDHGITHSRIIAGNGIKMLEYLKNFTKTNIEKEKIGNFEDSVICILIASYFHDIGISISRDHHEFFSMILGNELIKKILKEIYGNDNEKICKMLCIIDECIVCHMGNANPTSIEARTFITADGTDIEAGRARIPFNIKTFLKNYETIHLYSALAIKNVEIQKGRKKPIRIFIDMKESAGVFQVEEILMNKIRSADFEEFVEIIVKIPGEKQREIKWER